MFNRWVSRIAILLSIVSCVIITTSLVIGWSPTVHGYVFRTIDDLKSRSVSVNKSAYSDSPLTVLIYARGNCPSCAASASELKQFVEKVRHLPYVTTRLITPRSADEEQGFADSIGLEKGSIITASRREIEPVQAIPAVVIVNGSGRIMYKHLGKVTSPPDLAKYLDPLKQKRS
jgi:peroxiredoxin